VIHLGPLTQGDIPLELIAGLADRATVSLDIQGFVREVEPGEAEWKRIRPAALAGLREILSSVTILKASEDEARLLSDREKIADVAADLAGCGPSEVLITRADDATLYRLNGHSHWVPAYSARVTDGLDPTGAGDTFMAGYLYFRDRTGPCTEAARFAAMAATLKLEQAGPFRGTEADVLAFANKLKEPFS
jgi:sugar/nucleoside kinase (ribokinase family)